jgi:hypothetical protein
LDWLTEEAAKKTKKLRARLEFGCETNLDSGRGSTVPAGKQEVGYIFLVVDTAEEDHLSLHRWAQYCGFLLLLRSSCNTGLVYWIFCCVGTIKHLRDSGEIH